MPGTADPPLRAHEPLRHRGLGDEERVRDLGSREPADLAQREGDATLGSQRGMAAREHEGEALVGDRAHVVLVRRELLQPADELGLALEDLLATDPVDRAVPCRRDDPCARSSWHAVARPPLERGRERILHGVLGELEVTENAGEDRDRMAPLLSKDLLDALLHASVIAGPAGSRCSRVSPTESAPRAGSPRRGRGGR